MRYQHTCSNCTFKLRALADGSMVDFYRCGNEVVARYSDDAGDYKNINKESAKAYCDVMDVYSIAHSLI